MRVDKPIKQELQGGQVKTKYFQKFCDRWLELFHPWLARCEDEPNKPFCKACQTRLDCNRCHLQRHERTSKHARNLEILISRGETAARQGLTIRQERSKYYQQRKKFNIVENEALHTDTIEPEEGAHEFMDDTEPDSGVGASESFHFIHTDQTNMNDHQIVNEIELKEEHCDPLPEKKTTNIGRQVAIAPFNNTTDRVKILMQIQKDKHDLMDTFKGLIQDSLPTTKAAPKEEKNTLDLFFESVCCSVKALSPKLIAETKMRISNLICEMELRELTENDVNAKVTNTIGSSNTGATVLLSTDQSVVSGTYIINPPTRNVMHAPMETPEMLPPHQHEEVHHYETLA